MQTFLTILQVFLSLGLIGLVLMQHGKGADAGAAFGSGASSTVFGAQGSGSFLTRATAIIATLFFLTSMALAYYATKAVAPKGLMDDLDQTIVVPSNPSEVTAPVVPESHSDVPALPVTDVPDATLPASANDAEVDVQGEDVPASPEG